MAENFDTFILRRRRSQGFSKCRLLRTCFNVPSRSSFFFNRRRAFSTDSPFLIFTSLNLFHILSISSFQRSHRIAAHRIGPNKMRNMPKSVNREIWHELNDLKNHIAPTGWGLHPPVFIQYASVKSSFCSIS